jgi:signal transduction histidine kinase
VVSAVGPGRPEGTPPAPDAGLRPVTRRRLRIGVLVAVLVTVVVVAAATAALRLTASIDRLRQLVTAAQVEARNADLIMDALLSAENGLRGYLLTGRPGDLEYYWNALGQTSPLLDQLDRATANEPTIHADIAPLRGVVEMKMAELVRIIQTAQVRGSSVAIAAAQAEMGHASLDPARQLLSRIASGAHAQRDRVALDLAKRQKLLVAFMLAAGATGLLLLGFTALRLLASGARLGQAQNVLALQSARLQATIDQMRDGIAVFDAQDRLELWNSRFFPTAGLSFHLARQGTPYAEIAKAAEGWAAGLLALPRPASDAAPVELHRDGQVLEVWRSTLPDGGQMVTIADITRRTQAEAIGRHAQKMEALGQLTGGVAHDFNNLLQVISANLELLAPRIEPGNVARDRLAAALAAVNRGARLTGHLLAFARRQPLAPEAVDAVSLLTGLEDTLRRTLGETVEMHVLLDDGLWPIRADRHQLENAALNLSLNARDAMPRGGRLTISARNVALDDDYVRANVDASVGQYVMIAVTDTGIGMMPAQLARAVEPFYTTKPEGRGTGLGLSMVYGFARQSGGHFKLFSEPGKGTTARIYIPRSLALPRKPSRTALDKARPAAASLAALRVLLVEDDELVRMTTADLLADMGHDVVMATTAAMALQLVDSRLDVLVTDMVLPDMDGRELAALIRARRPGLPVVIATGSRIGDRLPDYEWLEKPYDDALLRAALARAMRSTRLPA